MSCMLLIERFADVDVLGPSILTRDSFFFFFEVRDPKKNRSREQ